MRTNLVFGGLVAASLGFGLAPGASAGPLFDTSLSSCTGENCSSVSVGGSLLGFGTSFAYPWVGQIFAGGAECLRLDVTNQSQDLEIVAVSPRGEVFRNDDRPGSTRPLVKIRTVSAGWYTVQVSTFNGTAVDADFTLAFGRYTSSVNPNCASATAPTLALAAEAAKGGEGGIGARAAGGPGSAR